MSRRLPSTETASNPSTLQRGVAMLRQRSGEAPVPASGGRHCLLCRAVAGVESDGGRRACGSAVGVGAAGDKCAHAQAGGSGRGLVGNSCPPGPGGRTT